MVRSRLVEVPADAVQVSPLFPGAARLEDLPEGQTSQLFMRAPANTLERQHDMALALRAVRPGGMVTILAPKDRGGSRLAKELAQMGLRVSDQPKRHHRICEGARPSALTGTQAAIAAGAMRLIPALGLYGQPGMFSFDRLDPGTALLLDHLPALQGRGADLGCGAGVLARHILQAAKVGSVVGLDLDRRAIEACAMGLRDARFQAQWRDVRAQGTGLKNLDFVVMNPPFHDAGQEDQALGLTFIVRAAESLRPGGKLWLTANRHLPYEAVLRAHFSALHLHAEGHGYKIYEAVR